MMVCSLGQLDNAVSSFTHALNLDPFFTDALISRGNSLLEFCHEVGRMLAK